MQSSFGNTKEIKTMTFKANEDNVRILGRTKSVDDIRYINYSCSGVEFEFTGTKVSAVLCSDKSKWEDSLKAWVAVFVDDEETPSKRFPLDTEEAVYELYNSDTCKPVKIRLMKVSEVAFAYAGIKEIIVEAVEPIKPTKNKEHKIEFIGDSITCGYGIEGVWNVDTFTTAQENPWSAYAAKTARHFDADFRCVSWSGIGIISSWTEVDEANDEWLMPMLYKYTDAAFDRNMGKTDFEVWDNSTYVPDLIIINLGTNDNSYTKGIDERIEKFTTEYYNLLSQVRACNPTSEIICTLGAMGQDLCPAVEKAVMEFARETNDTKVHSMRFEVQLESDGIGADWHPVEITHDKMSKRLIEEVKKIMKW